MTVKELIEFLQTQPQDLQVCYGLFSEQCLLQAKKIKVEELGEMRPDGWIPNKRPDQPTQTFLRFPGN